MSAIVIGFAVGGVIATIYAFVILCFKVVDKVKYHIGQEVLRAIWDVKYDLKKDLASDLEYIARRKVTDHVSKYHKGEAQQ